ncbi:MAG: TonB-dependent receptor [Spongiibacteraceae bacterium]|nr:TonB-dependent receptor [Spongiibacteraceae bacterium]
MLSPSKRFIKSVLSTGISSVLATSVITAHAQAPEGSSRSSLEEIVITAERRVVSLQETPISATVLTSKALFEKGIDNLGQIQQVAPSLAINSYNRSTFINIRGVGIAQSAPTSNPGVAYYLDGVLIPHEQFIGQSFFDLGSIEVLRGPQGTLTGQNSTGGAIYVRSAAPDSEALFGYIDQTVASDGWYRTVGALNVPTGESSALRVAAVYENKDGFVDNLGPAAGMDPGSSELSAFRLNWKYQPTDGQTYHVRYESFDYETGNIAVKDRDDTNPDPFEISYDGRSYLDQKGYRVSLEGRWDLSDSIQFRALFSDQDGYTKDQSDGDRAQEPAIPAGLPASGGNRRMFPGRVSRARTDFETSITEVNLLSIDDSAIQWVVGAFHMTDDVPVELYRDNYSTRDFVTSNSDIVAKAENTSESIFGQIDASVTDSLTLTLGLRYSEDEQVYTRTMLPGPPPPGCFPCDTTQESSETTGRIGLSYQANDDTMIYATFSKGYKAGGVNLDPRQGNFDPEINEVLEIGIKTTLDDGRLRLNGDVFYSDYQDIQLASLLALFGPPLPVTQNAASADIWGLELELEGAYDRLSFNVGLSVIDGSFSDDVCINNSNSAAGFIDSFCVGQNGLPPGNELVKSGDDLPFSPKVTANVGIQYTMDFGSVSVTPRFQVSYIDEQLATPFDTQNTYVEDRTVADIRVKINPSEDLVVEVFATNVFDEEYIASQIQDSSSADGGAIYGSPRQYGLRVKYDF